LTARAYLLKAYISLVYQQLKITQERAKIASQAWVRGRGPIVCCELTLFKQIGRCDFFFAFYNERQRDTAFQRNDITSPKNACSPFNTSLMSFRFAILMRYIWNLWRLNNKILIKGDEFHLKSTELPRWHCSISVQIR